jgi:acetyl esterase
VSPELHPQIRALLDAAQQDGDRWPPDLEAARAGYLRETLELGGAIEPVARVEDVVIPRLDGGRVRARAYWPAVPAAPSGTIVWLHGGGWYLGDLDGVDRVCRQLANAAGAVCVSVDYRLAPEHPYPAAVHDARAAVTWAAGAGASQLGTDPARVAVGGDSAGGNLAAVAARHHAGALRAQLLVYPALDAGMGGESHRAFAEDPMLRAVDLRRCWDTYLAGADGASDPDVSPLAAGDLAGLPRAAIAVAGHDVLRDDGLRYAAALQAAGVPVALERFDDMTHGFLRWGGVVDRARELIVWLGGEARAALA